MSKSNKTDATVEMSGLYDGNRKEAVNADLKEQVVLVFTLKEFKAMLQFCSQAADQSLPVSISFFWGGKPIVVKTNVEGLSGELVMATLDHKLMASMKTSSTSGPPPR